MWIERIERVRVRVVRTLSVFGSGASISLLLEL